MIQLKRKSGFTLIELLVSIAVFLLLLVMMLQFLAGTQQIWKGTSGRGDVFVESKAAMDLVSSLLRETYYAQFENEANPAEEKKVLFRVVRNNGDDKMYFVGRSSNSFGEKSINDMYVFRIGRNGDKLQIMGIPSTFINSGNFVTSSAYQKAINGEADAALYTALDTQNNGNDNPKGETIIERVTSLEIIPGYWTTSPKKFTWLSDSTTRDDLPSAVLLQIKMLDQANYELYQELPDAAKADFRKANELTFSRVIYFDNRDYVAQ